MTPQKNKTGSGETATMEPVQKKKIEEGQESLFEKFFIHGLKDIYYTEKKLVDALKKLEDAATTEELKEAFSDHRHQTQKHIKRVEKCFSLLGLEAEEQKCDGIEGILKEAEKVISETKAGTMTRDAALIHAAQKAEHYEIATYGGLAQFAITMGQNEIADILEKTLKEEEETDLNLTDVAESFINIEAEEEERYSWKRKAQENQHSKDEKSETDV